MNDTHDLDRRMADYYATEAPSRAPNWLLTQTLDSIETTPQRRWGFGGARLGLPDLSLRRLSIALGGAVAVLVVVALAFGSFGERQAVGGPPTASPFTERSGNWSRTLLEPAPPHVHAITAGGPGLVAVGATDAEDDLADIWTSSDGRTWSRVPGEELGPGLIEDVTTGGPGLVAVGGGPLLQAAVWTSLDGLTWSRAPDDPVFKDAHIKAVSTGGPGLVAVGWHHRAWFSSDGLTWKLASVPPVPPDVYPGDDGDKPQIYLTDVAAAGDRLVAVGWAMMNDNSEVAVVWTSADGTTWTDVPIDPDVLPRGSRFSSLTGGPDGFIASGEDALGGPAMWTSGDGLRWRQVGSDAFRSAQPEPDAGRVLLSSVAAGSDGYVAVGSECTGGDPSRCSSTEAAVWTSQDGSSWVRVPTGPLFRSSAPADPEQATGASEAFPWGSGLLVMGEYEGEGAVWISGPPAE